MIFHSYVSLPEGMILSFSQQMRRWYRWFFIFSRFELPERHGRSRFASHSLICWARGGASSQIHRFAVQIMSPTERRASFLMYSFPGQVRDMVSSLRLDVDARRRKAGHFSSTQLDARKLNPKWDPNCFTARNSTSGRRSTSCIIMY